MANKKIEMTPKELSLFNEMKKLAKRANQRILRLERETGIAEPFSVKQLADKLSIDTLNVWTKSNRIGVRKDISSRQMKAVIKATKDFLDKKSISTVKQAKIYQAKISLRAGRKVSFIESNAEFQAKENYSWIYQYLVESDFWSVAREAIKERWGIETWIDNLSVFITDRALDEDLRYDLINLYQYALGVKN